MIIHFIKNSAAKKIAWKALYFNAWVQRFGLFVQQFRFVCFVT
jgi:hypothetical protein